MRFCPSNWKLTDTKILTSTVEIFRAANAGEDHPRTILVVEIPACHRHDSTGKKISYVDKKVSFLLFYFPVENWGGLIHHFGSRRKSKVEKDHSRKNRYKYSTIISSSKYWRRASTNCSFCQKSFVNTWSSHIWEIGHRQTFLDFRNVSTERDV